MIPQVKATCAQAISKCVLHTHVILRQPSPWVETTTDLLCMLPYNGTRILPRKCKENIFFKFPNKPGSKIQ